MIGLSGLPALNATLNGLTATLLIVGYVLIRSGREGAHRACMVAALLLSVAFLTSYLVYHYNVGSIRFTADGWIRPVYFSILLSHAVLAVVVVPLVVVTVVRAFRGRFERHRRVARWTLPVWLYVSVTGVLVYLMLYRWFPSAELG